MTALLEYLDLTALLEYIDLLNRYSGGPSWGLLEPLSGWGPGQNAPVAPPVGGPARNGCDVRKILITTIQVNLVPLGLGTKFTLIVVIKIFTINLPSQPFLGHHLGFHIFFHHSLSQGCIRFLQLGYFGLHFTSFVFVYPKAGQ